MTDKDTIIAAQEAEILRLQGALDDLKVKTYLGTEKIDESDFQCGYIKAMSEIHDYVITIQGELK